MNPKTWRTLMCLAPVVLSGCGERPEEVVRPVGAHQQRLAAWAPTASPMSHARYDHTATVLPNGKVLVVGGLSGSTLLASAELYEPSTGAWTPAGSLQTVRYRHTATLLPDGKVLVAGGYAGGWTENKVLVAGGYDASFKILASAELYDPTGNGTTTSLEHTLSEPRRGHTASLLANGKVLVVGGRANTSVSNTAALYDPSTKTWSTTAAMTSGRVWHEASALPTGQVLVTGGYDSSGAILSSAELYTP
ncbi:Kelch repeat-containing protein [Archangium lipolyticum]|uniref:Kelch repeat-containing protein n=1 Tax=Archangium lipolyticum TaxID=2970465 RepID=UPI00214A2B25|nr:kelch repeat-containing protein [Archangium lipolyticum]